MPHPTNSEGRLMATPDVSPPGHDDCDRVARPGRMEPRHSASDASPARSGLAMSAALRFGSPRYRAGAGGTAMAAPDKPDTSLTLLERVQRFPADREAWDEFVRRYHPVIHAWCRKWGLQS